MKRPLRAAAPAWVLAATLLGSVARVHAAPAAPADLGTLRPAIGPPRAAGRAVDWTPRGSAAATALGASLAALAGSGEERFWAALVDSPAVAPYAWRRLAAIQLARGDSALADRSLARLAEHETLWQWEALRERADLFAARGDFAGADAMLERAERNAWPELERAAWLLRRARLRVELGDDDRAVDFARQLIRRYPALAPATHGVTLLEDRLARRSETLSIEDERAAAEVAAFRGQATLVVRRLERAARRAPAEAVGLRLRLVEILRREKRFAQAVDVAREALAGAGSDAGVRARVELEQARIERDAGRHEAALALYARAAERGDSTVTPVARWEAGAEAEQAGSLERARAHYAALSRWGGERAADARFRLGLLLLVDAHPESAAAVWSADSSAGARFWSAIARRHRDRAASDSALARLARLPGYDFYAAAARETLGIGGWPGSVASDACPDSGACAPLQLARGLLVLSESALPAQSELLRADALLVLSRWIAGDPRVAGGAGAGRAPEALLAAARLAFGANRMALGIQAARYAAQRAPATGTARAWAIAPWAFPVVFDSLFRRVTADDASPERALVLAVAWQESKFETRARSRSNALGLMQLKLPAALDAARWLKEPTPTEARLHDPGLSLRYGAAYLRRMIQRFEGRVSIGLAAYNAGASRIPAGWRDWVAKGGDALAAELVPYPETRDYVKRILGVRQAYRELDPFTR